MFVKLFTGLPGAGKTAQLVGDMVKDARDEPHRPQFAMGVNGLKEGMAIELTPEMLEKWWELPPGSILYIDECQEEHLMPKDAGKPKAWVQRIAKVRHHGMTFKLTTQHPQNMSAFVRRLVDQHVHTVNKFGTSVIARYTWGQCMEEPQKKTAQKSAVQDLGTLPKEVFESYKSSQLHTRKRRLPKKFYLLLACALVAAIALASLPYAIRRMSHAGDVTAAKDADGSPSLLKGLSAAADPQAKVESEDKRLRSEDYAKWMRPRVDGMPWTAPAFDKLEVQAQPRVFCVANENGDCHCRTEQGTRYEVDLNMCRALVKEGGPYNPFQPPTDLIRSDAPSRATPVAALPPGSPVMAVATMGKGGWDRSVGTPSYVPPEHTVVGAVGQ